MKTLSFQIILVGLNKVIRLEYAINHFFSTKVRKKENKVFSIIATNPSSTSKFTLAVYLDVILFFNN